MICPHCGAELPRRGRARFFITGSLLIAAALVLVLFIHLAVAVLAAVIMVTAGSTFFKGAAKAGYLRCKNCGKLPRT
jgi:hypothetical protein